MLTLRTRNQKATLQCLRSIMYGLSLFTALSMARAAANRARCQAAGSIHFEAGGWDSSAVRLSMERAAIVAR